MSFFGVQKLTYRTEVLEKAHLSADDKTKIKALLDLPNAVGLMLSHFGLYWAHVEPFWAILGAVLSMQGVCQKYRKYQQKNTLFGLVADGLCSLFWVMCVSFLRGMLQLVYVCLISGLCWTILGYVSAMLACVGPELGPYWLYPGPFWAMLGHFRPHWERIGLVLSPLSGILLFVLDLLGLCLSDLGLLHLGYAGLIANTWAMPTLFQAHVQFALGPEPLKLWYSRF